MLGHPVDHEKQSTKGQIPKEECLSLLPQLTAADSPLVKGEALASPPHLWGSFG